MAAGVDDLSAKLKQCLFHCPGAQVETGGLGDYHWPAQVAKDWHADGGDQAQGIHQRLGAMMAAAQRHALFVQNVADIV